MNWFLTRPRRERHVLAVGGAVLAALLLYLVVWEPLATREAQLVERVAQQRSQLAWMVTAAAELRSLAPQDPSPTGDGATLLSVIDRSADEAGLGGAVKRLAPEGEGRVRVWLGEAPYTVTIRWLESLAREGVVPLTVQMERTQTSGHLDARLLLSRAA